MEVFPPQALVFDLDGVLIDSFAANAKYYGYIAAQMGLPPLTRHDEDVVHRLTHEGALLHLCGPQRLAEALAKGRDYHAKQMQRDLRLFPQVAATLKYLQPLLPLAVGTNRNTSTMDILREMGILHYFTLVLTSGQAPKPKPEKEFMDCLLQRLGFSPEQVVYVGDSLVDEQLCDNAGVRLVAFKNQQLGAWRYVDQFADIVRVLGLG